MSRYLTTSSLLGYSLLATVFALSDLLDDLHVFTGPLFGGQLYQEKGYATNGLTHEKREQKCWEDLGCFGIDDEFYDAKYRPVNVLPLNREDINTRFLLFTRSNPNEIREIKRLDMNSFAFADYQPHRLTKIIIHGLLDSFASVSWLERMKNAFLERDDYNVIVVDWSGGNKLPYTRATANCRLVAAELSHLLTTLIGAGLLDPESVHIIGHSLGAHIGGYVGQRIKNLGRITALDPAEPYFQKMPVSVRIDPSDALFVDAWHTDAGSIYQLSLGMNEQVGHVDFFPNNGRDQPGCFPTDPAFFETSNGIIDGMRKLVACNHERSTSLFIDAIKRSPCQHIAYACPSYAEFQNGRCSSCGEDGSQCAIMGLDIDNIQYLISGGNQSQPQRHRFFVKTAEKEPYCVFHHKVTVELDNKDLFDTMSGRFALTLLGSQGEEKETLLGESSGTFMGSNTYLVTSANSLDKISGLKIQWKSDRWLSSGEVLNIKSVTLSPMSTWIKRSKDSRTFSSSSKESLPPSTSLTLKRC